MIPIPRKLTAFWRRWQRDRLLGKAPPPPVLHRLLSQARGIIHVGANKGQEAALYHRYNLPVIWVEADPETTALLQLRVADYPRQKAVSALLADVAGKDCTFHVADNGGQSSSLLPPKLHTTIWPDVKFSRSVNLKSTTLDDMLDSSLTGTTVYDVLIMDTQGSELLVLKGAERTLSKLAAVKTEAADFEAYEGCCTLTELDTWLQSRGFVRAHTEESSTTPGIGSYYEALYEKAPGNADPAAPSRRA